MRLVAGHGCRRIVQNNQSHIRLIIKRIHCARNSGREERGIPHKSKALGIRFNMSYALRDADARPHAETGVAHVQRRRIPERVAADIAAVDRLLPAHRNLDRIEGSPVGTSRAQHRRPDRQGRRLGQIIAVFAFVSFSGFRGLSKIFCQRIPYNLHGVFSRGRNIAGELAADLHFQAVLAAGKGERALDHGIQLFHTQYFIESFQELQRQLLGERERRRHSHDAGISATQGIQRVHKVDAVGRNTFAALRFIALFHDPVPAIL